MAEVVGAEPSAPYECVHPGFPKEALWVGGRRGRFGEWSGRAVVRETGVCPRFFVEILRDVGGGARM